LFPKQSGCSNTIFTCSSIDFAFLPILHFIVCASTIDLDIINQNAMKTLVKLFIIAAAMLIVPCAKVQSGITIDPVKSIMVAKRC
jgi:hypothetical protein